MSKIVKSGNVEFEFGKVVCELIRESRFHKDMLVAQLRQEIVAKYPSRVANAGQDFLFAQNEFGFAAGQTFKNPRVAFWFVPMGTTREAVQARLDALYTAGKYPSIQRSMSMNPFLEERHERMIAAGRTTLEVIKNSQLAKGAERGPDGQAILGADGKANIIPLKYKDMTFYRKNVLIPDFAPDVDLRPTQVGAIEKTAISQVAEAEMVEELTATV
jgi:G:T/U-mismatch repair DNA glycosylase